MSVISNFGANPCFLSSLRISLRAAWVSRRLLNKHVEDLAFVVNGTPEVHALAADPDHHFVQVPSVARATAAPSKPSRDHRSKLQHPASDGLIGYVEPALGEEILDVSVPEREAQVKPDSMLDDNRRKPVTTV